MPSSRQLENAFTNCVSMQSIDLTTDITSTSNYISYASYAFAGDKALTTVDLGDYFVDNRLALAVSMFEGCSSLSTIVGTIWIGAVDSWTALKDMFKGCSSLSSVNINCGYNNDPKYRDLMVEDVTIEGVTYDYAYEYLGLTAEQMSNAVHLYYNLIYSIGD